MNYSTSDTWIENGKRNESEEDYICDRLRKNTGWSETKSLLNGYQVDTVFYDKVTDRLWRYMLYKVDTVTGEKIINIYSPKKWGEKD